MLRTLQLFSSVPVCFYIYMRHLKINGYLPPSPSFVLDQEVVLLFILNTPFLFHTFSFDSFILFLDPFKSLYKREEQKNILPTDYTQ